MSNDQAKRSIYERYGFFTDDAASMERAIQVENLFSLIRENKISEYQSAVSRNPASLYAMNNLRETALHTACKYDRKEILSFILENMPKNFKAEDRFINKRDAEGFSALMVCADMGRTECAELLMTHKPDLKIVGYDLKRNVAHLAAQKNHPEILRMVLTATENKKKILDIHEKCKDKAAQGFMPIHFAASNVTDESIRILDELGADVNAKALSRTPLMIALKTGSLATATYLLNHENIDLTRRDTSGYVAYHYARHYGAPKVMVKRIRKMTEEQFKVKYPKIVSNQTATISPKTEHTKE